MSRINGMRGIVRKKYGNEHLLKKSRRVSKPASSKRVKKSIKKIKQSSTKIDKARAEIYSMQRSSAQRQKNLLAKAERLGLQESLSKELFETPVFYDVRTIDTIGKANRIKKEIEAQRKEWTIATRRVERDIKKIDGIKQDARRLLESRNKIIDKYLENASGEERANIRGTAMRYTEKELVAGIRNNPIRYYHKEDYYKYRSPFESDGRDYNPLYESAQFRKRVTSHYTDKGFFDDELWGDYAKEIYDLFMSMTDDEIAVFRRLNTYESATNLLPSTIEELVSHGKEIMGVIQRVKYASRG